MDVVLLCAGSARLRIRPAWCGAQKHRVHGSRMGAHPRSMDQGWGPIPDPQIPSSIRGPRSGGPRIKVKDGRPTSIHGSRSVRQPRSMVRQPRSNPDPRIKVLDPWIATHHPSGWSNATLVAAQGPCERGSAAAQGPSGWSNATPVAAQGPSGRSSAPDCFLEGLRSLGGCWVAGRWTRGRGRVDGRLVGWLGGWPRIHPMHPIHQPIQ